MTKLRLPRRAILVGLLLAVTLLGAAVWRIGYVQALERLARQGASDLALASDRVVGQLQRYRELAVLMSDHPDIQDLADLGNSVDRVEELFQRVADKTSALDILFVARDGQVLAAARNRTRRNVENFPFVQRAMQGALGSGHGADMLVAPRAYYFASPYFGSDGLVRGAVIVAADIGEIEWDWTGSNPAVFFSDQSGQVFITNRSELTWWKRSGAGRGLVSPSGFSSPVTISNFSGLEIWRVKWGPYLPEIALHIVRDLPVIGMQSEALIDVTPARRLAFLQAASVSALCVAFGVMLIWLTERRRVLAIANARLEARVAARTKDLSESNRALRREVREREDAEEALRQAQAELVQAGKLSALGQMSAGISHELNQPLMAIQNFAENATAFLERGNSDRAEGNLQRISGLAHRMARIIQNLRSFARQESAPVSRVDMRKVLDSAVELTSPRLRESGVDLSYKPPLEGVWVQGGEVRLSQVFVNLITNAADAMADRPVRRLSIELVEGDHQVTVLIQDSGPGIEMPDKVFEPFYSTKAGQSQSGMGLGLSISYGIVQSFGGVIRGSNSPSGGAVFSVELERWPERGEEAA